jgi:hypothetical protein
MPKIKKTMEQFDETELIANVFGRVDAFVKAANHLTMMPFYTNPIDMLYEGHCALEKIHSAIIAHHERKVNARVNCDDDGECLHTFLGVGANRGTRGL